MEALFPDHPYGRPVLGWEEDIEGLTYQDALAFHAKWYAPNNAALIVAGDTDLAGVLRLADATYGQIPARPLPPRRGVPFPRKPKRPKLIEVSDQASVPQWQALAAAPSFGKAPAEDVAALSILMKRLGGGLGSRLERELMQKRELAHEVGFNVDARPWG